jgi:hypothetical protein
MYLFRRYRDSEGGGGRYSALRRDRHEEEREERLKR